MEDKSKLIYKMMRSTEEMHPNDPRTMIILDEAAELLMQDINWALRFLERDCNYEMIDWLCGTFIELSWHFGSLKFLAIIQDFVKRYPNNESLAYFVGIAEQNTHDKIIDNQEKFTERITIRLAELAHQRPLLAREQYERDTLSKLIAVASSREAYLLETEIDSQAIDPELKKRLLSLLEEKQELFNNFQPL
jgi:hypothetical protein